MSKYLESLQRSAYYAKSILRLLASPKVDNMILLDHYNNMRKHRRTIYGDTLFSDPEIMYETITDNQEREIAKPHLDMINLATFAYNVYNWTEYETCVNSFFLYVVPYTEHVEKERGLYFALKLALLRKKIVASETPEEDCKAFVNQVFPKNTKFLYLNPDADNEMTILQNEVIHKELSAKEESTLVEQSYVPSEELTTGLIKYIKFRLSGAPREDADTSAQEADSQEADSQEAGGTLAILEEAVNEEPSTDDHYTAERESHSPEAPNFDNENFTDDFDNDNFIDAEDSFTTTNVYELEESDDEIVQSRSASASIPPPFVDDNQFNPSRSASVSVPPPSGGDEEYSPSRSASPSIPPPSVNDDDHYIREAAPRTPPGYARLQNEKFQKISTTRKEKEPWTDEETAFLEEKLYELGVGNWQTICNLKHGILGHKKGGQLKDKAKSECLRRKRLGLPLGGFQCYEDQRIANEKKKAKAKAAKEARKRLADARNEESSDEGPSTSTKRRRAA